jgi:hypothetical protein
MCLLLLAKQPCGKIMQAKERLHVTLLEQIPKHHTGALDPIGKLCYPPPNNHACVQLQPLTDGPEVAES